MGRRLVLEDLDAGLLVIRQHGKERSLTLRAAGPQDFDLRGDAEDAEHLRLELRIALLQIVTNLMDLGDGSPAQSAKRRVPCGLAVAPCMLREQAHRPHLFGVPEVLRLLARERDQPRTRIIGDCARSPGTRQVLEGGARADRGAPDWSIPDRSTRATGAVRETLSERSQARAIHQEPKLALLLRLKGMAQPPR